MKTDDLLSQWIQPIVTRSRQIQNQNRSQLSTHHSSCDVYKGQQTEKGRFFQNRFRVKATAEFNLTLNQ